MAENQPNVYISLNKVSLLPVSSVIWMDIVYIDNMRRRVTVCGHHSGIVTLSMVDLNKSGKDFIQVS